MKTFLLGLDSGNTMTKAVLFDLQGQEVGVEQRRNPIYFPAPGHTERDADRMWQDGGDAIRTLLQTTRVSPANIAGVAVTGYGAGLYLVDERGSPTRMGIMSTDLRAQPVIDRWAIEGLSASNSQRVHQRFWSGQPAPLLAWLARHEPEVVRRTRRVLFCKDFLRAKLCGEFATDPTDAGLAGLINVTRQAYDPAFFESLGLDAWVSRLPDIRPTTGMAGIISNHAAGMTGLLEGTPVFRGVVDVAAAALGSGVTKSACMSVIAGTFSINSTLHAKPRMDRLPFIQIPYPVDAQYLATEASPTSAGNFEWYCKSMLGPAVVAAAEESGCTIYEAIGSQVPGAMGRPNDILFLPFLFGGPQGAPASFIGIKASHNTADIVRAVFEGIVFAHRLDIEMLRQGSDTARVSSIRLAGGAARNDSWVQMFADVLGLVVETTEGSEQGALGASMSAAIGGGIYADWTDAIRGMVRVTRRFEPRATWQEVYERKYRCFKRHVACLAELYAEAS